jgi:hypothetical protein
MGRQRTGRSKRREIGTQSTQRRHRGHRVNTKKKLCGLCVQPGGLLRVLCVIKKNQKLVGKQGN